MKNFPSAVELQALADAPAGAPNKWVKTPPPKLLELIWPPDWQGQPVPPRDFIVEGMIPNRNVTLLTGDGGLGKTLLAMQMMVAADGGRPWIGAPTDTVKTFGMFCEDEPEELHRRLADVVAHYGCELGDLTHMNMTSRVGKDNVLVEFDRQDRGRTTKLYGEVLDYVVTSGTQLAIFDSLHDLFAGNENIRTQARQFIGFMRRLAVEMDGAVVITAHPSAAGLSTGSGTSGSTAWNNAVRSRLYLTRPAGEDATDDGARILKTMKQNYGPRGQGINLQWKHGVFIAQAAGSTSSTNLAAFHKAKETFLELLKAYNDEGRPVSATPSANYAPAIFAKDARSFKAGKLALQDAMNTLMADGKIRVGEYGPSSRRRTRLEIVPTLPTPFQPNKSVVGSELEKA